MAAQADLQESKGDQHSSGLFGLLLKGLAFPAAAFVAVMQTVTKDGTVAAIAREAVKDVRDTTHDVFFGRGERPGEPGAPLNPTQGEVAADRMGNLYGHRSPESIAADRGGVHGEPHGPQAWRSPDEIAASRGGIHGQGDDGMALMQKKPDGQGWADWIEQQRQKPEGNAEDSYGRGKGRSLPEEEQQKQKEREGNERGGRGC